MPREVKGDAELLRKWVETWQRAGDELERLRRIEIKSLDTHEAIRRIFGDGDLPAMPPAEPMSGLVEQQKWFARLRAHRNP